MDCVCVPFKGWIGKTKDLSVFERGKVVGARRTGVCQELQRCRVFHAQQFHVCTMNGPPPNWHPANFTQLWEALAVLLLQFQLFCLRLWNPDLFTGRAACPRPAVFYSLETAGAVEILSMVGCEKPTDIYSWGADLLHPRQLLWLLLFDHAGHLWTFEHLGHVLL